MERSGRDRLYGLSGTERECLTGIEMTGSGIITQNMNTERCLFNLEVKGLKLLAYEAVELLRWTQRGADT